MPNPTPAPTPFSPEAYAEWEQTQTEKHEYVAGHVRVIPAGGRDHVLVVGNALFALHRALRETDCTVLLGSLRVQIQRGARYTYPDLSAVCGEEIYADHSRTTLVNPTLVVEVLSERTKAYDRGDKLAAYREIESLRQVVLVAQDRPFAELYTRDDTGRWSSREVWEGETLDLASVGAEIALDDLYAGVSTE